MTVTLRLGMEDNGLLWLAIGLLLGVALGPVYVLVLLAAISLSIYAGICLYALCRKALYQGI